MDIQFDDEVKRARFPLLAWLTSRQAFWVLLAVCIACVFLSFATNSFATSNNIFNVAEADGLSVLAANPNVAMGQLAKLPNVRFDVSKFIWLGSSGPDGSMFSIRASLPKLSEPSEALGR